MSAKPRVSFGYPQQAKPTIIHMPRFEAPSNLTTCTATNFQLALHTCSNTFPSSSLLYKRHRMQFVTNIHTIHPWQRWLGHRQWDWRSWRCWRASYVRFRTRDWPGARRRSPTWRWTRRCRIWGGSRWRSIIGGWRRSGERRPRRRWFSRRWWRRSSKWCLGPSTIWRYQPCRVAEDVLEHSIPLWWSSHGFDPHSF